MIIINLDVYSNGTNVVITESECDDDFIVIYYEIFILKTIIL